MYAFRIFWAAAFKSSGSSIDVSTYTVEMGAAPVGVASRYSVPLFTLFMFTWLSPSPLPRG